MHLQVHKTYNNFKLLNYSTVLTLIKEKKNKIFTIWCYQDHLSPKSSIISLVEELMGSMLDIAFISKYQEPITLQIQSTKSVKW